MREGRGIEPIPADARYGSLGRIFTVWFTPQLVPAAFFVGTLAAADFLKVGFVTGVLAILIGNVVGALLVGLLGTMGPATGMAQMPLARAAYGKSIVVPGLLKSSSGNAGTTTIIPGNNNTVTFDYSSHDTFVTNVNGIADPERPVENKDHSRHEIVYDVFPFLVLITYYFLQIQTLTPTYPDLVKDGTAAKSTSSRIVDNGTVPD